MTNSWLREFFQKLSCLGRERKAERVPRRSTDNHPDTFEQIYKSASVKLPKIAYGIQKVADMVHSPHLEGMSSELKRKALLMALSAAGSNEAEVLNDLVIRQRALTEYEDAFLNRVNLFESAQRDKIRLQHEELDKITGQFNTRIQASLDEVEGHHKEFRDWQESKRQELHRFAEAAALCVPQKEAEEEKVASNVMTILRPTGTFR